MRRVFIIAAVLVGIFGVPGGVLGQTWTSGATTVTLSGGRLTVSGTGAMADYVGDLPPWFSSRFSITAVVIGEGVTSIGGSAFYGLGAVTSVIIPNSVTTIGNNAFFEWGITSITIPNSVTSIGDGAFYGCIRLTSITIPNSVTTIGSAAFMGCTGLTSIIIGTGVTSIGVNAFQDCIGLTSISVVFANTHYSSENGVLFNKDQTVLIEYPKGKQGAYNIPNSVTSIGNNAFRFCTGLTSVIISNSVTSIGDYAFYHCSNLTSVTIGNSVTSIGISAFSWCVRLTSITIPDNVTSIRAGAFMFCTGLTSVIIGDGVTSIERSTFNECRNLTAVTIGKSVISIGDGAFGNCAGLTTVTIPNSVTSIGDGAFANTGLISVTIPNSVTSIGNVAFGFCAGLTSVTIGNSMTSIGDVAFFGCTGLTSIISLNAVPPAVGSDAFSNVNSNACLYVPQSSIGAYETATGWGFTSCVKGFTTTWDGTVNTAWYTSNPSASNFTITTAEQLAGLAQLVNNGTDTFEGKTITFGDNILLNDTTGWQDWADNAPANINSWVPIGNEATFNSVQRPFSGTFDGAGFVINGVYINNSSFYQGLFGYVGSGTIRNLGVTASYIKGQGTIGGLAGYMGSGGTITNSYAIVNAAGTYSVGGLVGSNSGTITNSFATGNVTGVGDGVGGLVGFGDLGTIINSFATGDVTVTGTIGNGGAGGLVGWGGTITDSYATGNVIGTSFVGGLVGRGGTITNSYATGNVTGTSFVGGLVGSVGTITNSNAAGNVTGTSFVGGLVGSGGTITNSYVTGNVTGTGQNVGGLTGQGGIITNSYATGDVTGTSAVGGLMGSGNLTGSGGTITNSYATGSVTGTEDIGGLLGRMVTSVTITNSHYNRSTAGTGFFGTPKTEAEMRSVEFAVLLNAGAYALSENDINKWSYSVGQYPTLSNSVYGKETTIGDFFANGDGTEDKPYIIETKNQLQCFSALVNLGVSFESEYIKLINDIALNDTTGWQNWTGYAPSANTNRWEPIGLWTRPFSGTFDGAGFVISGVFSYGSGSQGLFGYLGSDGTVMNIGVTASDIRGGSYTGGLVGVSEGTIINSYVTGNVTVGGSYVGGLVGQMGSGGTITNSYVAGNVIGADRVGGLVGEVRSGGTITNSYVAGNVIGTSPVGGLVGSGSITIINSYYNSANVNNGRGIPKTLVEMKQQSTYTNWNLAEIWAIRHDVNDGYPYLRVFKNNYDMSGITFENKTVIYDGKTHNILVSGTLPPNVEAEYVGNGVIGAGTYTVTANFTTSDVNYNFPSLSLTAKLTIDKTQLSITAADKTITYGDFAPDYTVSYNGFVNEETETVLVGELSFSSTYTKGSEAGMYDITPSGFTSTNYDITFVNGTLTVIPAYTVTVVSEGTGASGNGNYLEGATVNINAGTAPTGKYFVNWTSNPAVTFDDATSVITSFIMPAEAVTVTANYEVYVYTVTFIGWNGSVIDEQTINHGGAANEPNAPTSIAHNFTCWDVAFDNITDNLTVTAQWTIKTHTVTFIGWNGSVVDEQTVDHGSAANEPNTPTSISHNFTGWDVAFDNITEDLTVTAQWSIKTYTVRFMDGETVLASRIVDHGAAVTPPADPDSVSHNFTGWSITTFNNVTSSFDVAAEWSIKTYRVIFVGWNGEEIGERTVDHGGAVNEPDPPTSDSHNFDGWDIVFDNITGDLTVTAKWKIKTYTFLVIASPPNGGTIDGEGEYDHGDEVTLTAIPNAGYNFVNWTEGGTEISANTIYEFIASGGDRTLVVNFELKRYAVTVVGGSADKDEYLAGAAVTITADIPAGKRFVNWTTPSAGVTFANANNAATTFTMPSNNVTVTANFVDLINLAALNLNVTHATLTYTGSPLTASSIAVGITGGSGLEAGVDYTVVSVTSHTNAGTYVNAITIEGIGIYMGTVMASVTINPATINGLPRVDKFVQYTNVSEQSIDLSGLVSSYNTTSAALTYTPGSVTGDNPGIISGLTGTSSGVTFTLVGGSAENKAVIPVTVSGFANYNDVTVYIDVELTGKIPTVVTVTAPSNITYGETLGDPSVTAGVNGSFAYEYHYGGTQLNGAVYASSDKPTLPGTYTVTAVLNDLVYTGSGISAVFTIAAKALTWNGGTVVDKTYDRTVAAEVESTPTLSGIINSDNVAVMRGVASFVSVNANDDVAATASGWSVSGVDVWKYAVPPVQPLFANAVIGRKPITISHVYAMSRDYNETKSVQLGGGYLEGVIDGDYVDFDLGVGEMENALVGTNKPVTTNITLTGDDAKNYELEQPDDITVTIRPLTYLISVSSSSLPFGSLRSPYNQPAAQTVTVYNTGTGVVNLGQPTATYYDIGSLTSTMLNPSTSATFTVRPKANLPVGVYNEEITITNINGDNAKVTANFTVQLPVYIVTFVDGLGNNIGAPQTIEHGSDATPPTAPTRVTHDFTGWSGNYTNVTGDRTITALWSIKTYTVKFIDWNGEILKTQTVNHGAGATAPSSPNSKADGHFVNWDRAFNNVTGNLDVTAVYENHTYGDFTVTIPATCTHNGEQVRTCTVCGAKSDVAVIDMLGHNLTWAVTTPATCTQAGQETGTCQRAGCTHSATRSIDATGHNFGALIVTVPATCTHNGEQARTCSICGTKSDVAVIDMLGHNLTWAVTTPATCTQSGQETGTCQRAGCSHSDTRSINATGHNFGALSVTIPATCTHNGEQARTCSICGVKSDVAVIDMLGHNLTWAVTTPATCTQSGQETGTCQRTGCTHSATRSIDATGHNFGALTVTVPATCTHNGEQARTCSICGTKSEVSVIDMLGHNLTWAITTPATCTQSGQETGTCQRTGCTHSTTRSIDATGHNFGALSVTIPATCTHNGEQARTCSICGTKSDVSVIDMLGHSLTWAITTPATCTYTGEETGTCQRTDCTHKEVNEIPMLTGNDCRPTAISSPERTSPTIVHPNTEAGVALTGELTAGPNPVARSSGNVNFFRQGKRIESAALTIFDASGNVVNRIKITDNALDTQARREVGSWDLKDAKGRPVSEGTYLVRGTIKTADGKSERVSLLLGVR